MVIDKIADAKFDVKKLARGIKMRLPSLLRSKFYRRAAVFTTPNSCARCGGTSRPVQRATEVRG